MNTSPQPSADTFVTHLIATLPDLDARITDVRHDDVHLHIVRGEDVSVVEIAPFASCLLYTSPSPRDLSTSRMPSSA